MHKIAIVGPESSGKSTLSEALARRPQAHLVEEVARRYLGDLGRPYIESDLLAIAKAQVVQEERIGAGLGGILVCDTDLITIRIWSEEKFGRCDPWIIEQSEQRRYDHWLLCRPDIPWELDPLRENPLDRDRLFTVYETMLQRYHKPYTVVAGVREERIRTAMDVFAGFLRH